MAFPPNKFWDTTLQIFDSQSQLRYQLIFMSFILISMNSMKPSHSYQNYLLVLRA